MVPGNGLYGFLSKEESYRRWEGLWVHGVVALLRMGFCSRFGEVSLHSTILAELYDERLSEQWDFGLAI